MKEWATSIIGLAFALAMIIGFFMGRVPLEVIAPMAMAAVLWFFREREIAKDIKKIKESLK